MRVEGMRALLRGSLGRSLKTLGVEDKLAAAWTVACGRALAERGTVLGFEGGVLRVEVEDAVWLWQMRGMRSQLASEVSRIAGIKVSAIDFEMRGGQRAEAAARESSGVFRKRREDGKAR